MQPKLQPEGFPKLGYEAGQTDPYLKTFFCRVRYLEKTALTQLAILETPGVEGEASIVVDILHLSIIIHLKEFKQTK